MKGGIMWKGIFLFVLILSVALLLQSCESIRETHRTIPPDVALAVESEPASEYLETIETEAEAEVEREVEAVVEVKEEREAEAEVEVKEEDIPIKHDDAGTHYSLGVTYGNEGKHREAIEAYNQAIKIKPDYAEAHYNAGVSYVMLDEKDSALKEYKILKELDPQMAHKLSDMAIKKASSRRR